MSADLLTPKSPYSNTADQSNSIGSIFKVPKLQPTAERIYLKQPLLLVLKGKRRLMARSVKLEVSSLNQTDTFLLDLPINNTPSSSLNKTIRKLFVVSGQHTPMVSRARAIELANRIKDCDYSGKAEIELIELGGLKSRYIMNREIPFWACLIGDYENINAAVKASIDLTATNGVKDDLQFEEMELEQLELFEFPGIRLIAKRDLKRSMLKSDSVYVLCSNSEAFIWSGRQSDKSHKESALQFVAVSVTILF